MNLTGRPVTPKPEKVRPDLAYMRAVKSLPCCNCGKPGPSDAHHCKHKPFSDEHNPYDRVPSAGKRAGDRDTIPLCKRCHQDGPDAIHKSLDGWRERNGPDFYHIPPTRALVAAMSGEIDF